MPQKPTPILTQITPYPPSPAQPAPLLTYPRRNRTPLIIISVVSLVLIGLLGFAGYQGMLAPVTERFAGFQTQLKGIKLPKFTLPKITKAKTEEVATKSTVEPPPIPTVDPNLLIGRYPVRKYTHIRHKLLKTDYIVALIRQYNTQIFPKKYRDFRALARYNGVPPPQYILVTGEDFLIPTAEPIVAPKTGYDAELQQIQSQLKNDPVNPESLNRLGVIRVKRNELYLAQKVLRKGAEIAPENGKLHNNLGYVYLLLEDNKAQAELERASETLENPAVALCNLGSLYLTNGKADLAVRMFEEALGKDAELLDAKYNLAMAHKELGRKETAKQLLTKLSQRLPADEQVKSAMAELARK